jgi:putative transcriptional regulator
VPSPVSSTALAPGLLLSMPQLQDPHFTRAVVLMIEHGDEGSFGLIVNQPSEIHASELLESLSIPWRGAAGEMVWAGGPVQPTTGWVLHEPVAGLDAGDPRGMLSINDDFVLSTSPDKLRTLAAAPPRRLRLLLGYSGWAPGQLAAEMARGSWLHVDPDPALVFDTPADAMWQTALRSLGIDPENVVQSRGVH